MGSRAVIALCRDVGVAAERFGARGGETGAIWTRTGRPFFRDAAATEGLLARLRAAADAAGLWDELDTGWALLDGVDDLKVAPFHLLASEGRVWFDRDHAWHMGWADRLAAAGGVVAPTAWRTVPPADAAACAEAVGWWEAATAAGGGGMVVKPLDFVARRAKGLLQPALKVRGCEYLRIIYGPEYDAPEHLTRLRERGLSGKRNLALREFALGHEALTRFVAREPLRRVHECVFAVLASESEPIDPRL